MIEKIINLARDKAKKNGNVFDSDIISMIEKLDEKDRIKAIVEVIKKLNLDPNTYILYGKLKAHFEWITTDMCEKINERLNLGKNIEANENEEKDENEEIRNPSLEESGVTEEAVEPEETEENENFEMIEENEYNENVTKISRYAFNSFGIERSVRDLISWQERGKVVIPEFQRGFVWDFNKCCKFIESILLNLPTPNLFMFRDRNQEKDEKYILIDGLQRFNCIKQFVIGQYNDGKITKLFKINIKNSEWYNCTYELLKQEDRNSFDDYSLKINIFDSIENDEDTQKKYMIEIFERINTGSDKLTDQEIRNAVYSSNATKLLKETAKNEKLKKLLSCSKKYDDLRCNDQEFILRCLTYFQIYLRYKDGSKYIFENSTITTSKKNMMSQYLFFASKNKIKMETHIEKFINAIDIIHDFSINAFLGVSKDEQRLTTSVHEVFGEAIVIYVMLENPINASIEEFEQNKINYWYETASEDNPFYSKTTSKDSINKRIKVLKKILG